MHTDKVSTELTMWGSLRLAPNKLREFFTRGLSIYHNELMPVNNNCPHMHTYTCEFYSEDDVIKRGELSLNV